MQNENTSGVNTILIVLILVIVVGALVWIFRGRIAAPRQNAPENGKDINVDVNLPKGREN